MMMMIEDLTTVHTSRWFKQWFSSVSPASRFKGILSAGANYIQLDSSRSAFVIYCKSYCLSFKIIYVTDPSVCPTPKRQLHQLGFGARKTATPYVNSSLPLKSFLPCQFLLFYDKILFCLKHMCSTSKCNIVIIKNVLKSLSFSFHNWKS